MATRIAICLFEESINSLDPSNLLCGQPLTKVPIDSDDKDVSLYVKETNTNTPEWVEIVNSFSDLSKKNIETASSGAILFINVKDNILACCFGSSVGNINRDNLITDFGLAAAYQRINKRNYKTIESQTLSINPLTNNRSSAVATTQDSFNIDNVLESITELSGKFYLTARSVIIKGKEFFSIPSPFNLPDIKKLCEDLLEDYKIAIEDDTYKRLTATKKVKVKSLLDYLNDTLCEKLSKKDLSISLIDYELSSEIDSYSFGTKDRLTEISIEDLYGTFQRNFIVKPLYLKTKRINIYDSSNNNLANGHYINVYLFI